MIRRTIIILVLAAVLLGSLFCALIVEGANAYTVQGGTDSQQATVAATIEACLVDYRLVDDHYGDVTVRFLDLVNGVAGNSWNDGSIDVRSDLTGSYLAMVTAHEWSHNIYRMMPVGLHALWEDWCGPEADYRVWSYNPREGFAETARLALFPVDQTASSPLTILPVDADDAHELIYRWRLSLGCHFVDLAAEDAELQTAVAALAQEGIIQGYTDGTFGPYRPLLKRHVALICERSGLDSPGWTNDYSQATRGDVAVAVPGLTWFEERWGEGITRGQLARLIWRAM